MYPSLRAEIMGRPLHLSKNAGAFVKYLFDSKGVWERARSRGAVDV